MLETLDYTICIRSYTDLFVFRFVYHVVFV